MIYLREKYNTVENLTPHFPPLRSINFKSFPTLLSNYLNFTFLQYHSPLPLFFPPHLNVTSFQTLLPPFANFFTRSPLPPLLFFFFFSPNFPSLPSSNHSPQLSRQLQYYAHVRTHGGSLFSDVQAFRGRCSRLIEFIRSSASAL